MHTHNDQGGYMQRDEPLRITVVEGLSESKIIILPGQDVPTPMSNELWNPTSPWVRVSTIGHEDGGEGETRHFGADVMAEPVVTSEGTLIATLLPLGEESPFQRAFLHFWLEYVFGRRIDLTFQPQF